MITRIVLKLRGGSIGLFFLFFFISYEMLRGVRGGVWTLGLGMEMEVEMEVVS